MTDYDYDPIPSAPTERMADDVMIRSATTHYEFVSHRRTVRQFSDAPIDRSVIEACVLNAGSAPKGANHQPWHFVCVSVPAAKRAMREVAEEERAFYGGKAGTVWLNDLKKIRTDAPKPLLDTVLWLIAVFAERYAIDDHGNRRKNYYIRESVGIATEFLIQACHQLGLAKLSQTPNPMKFLNKILGRSQNERPFVLVVLGHPSSDAMVPRAATAEKTLSELVSFV